MKNILKCAALLGICLVAFGCGVLAEKSKNKGAGNAYDGEVPTNQMEASHYFGACHTSIQIPNEVSPSFLYDITVNEQEISFVLLDSYSKEKVSETKYDLSDIDYIPETVSQGLTVCDINRDGNDDFVFDLGRGFSGKIGYKACMVFAPDTFECVPIEEYELLNNPKFDDKTGIITTEQIPMEGEESIRHYVIDGHTLKEIE